MTRKEKLRRVYIKASLKVQYYQRYDNGFTNKQFYKYLDLFASIEKLMKLYYSYDEIVDIYLQNIKVKKD